MNENGKVTGNRDSDERRRFLKLGLLATPMIVTLCARPARAAETTGSLGVYDYGSEGGGMMDDGQDFRRI